MILNVISNALVMLVMMVPIAKILFPTNALQLVALEAPVRLVVANAKLDLLACSVKVVNQMLPAMLKGKVVFVILMSKNASAIQDFQAVFVKTKVLLMTGPPQHVVKRDVETKDNVTKAHVFAQVIVRVKTVKPVLNLPA